MVIEIDEHLPPCALAPEVFRHEALLSPPAVSELNERQRRDLLELRAVAHRQCAGCPQLIDCLYRAVVEVDVSGFAACTTETDRARIRRELGIEVNSALNGLGMPRSGGAPVSHAEVLQARRAHPDETCQQLADRLRCSASTIKRHLRRSQQDTVEETVDVKPPPTVDMVLECFDRLESSRVA